jgi:hypothetical protein
MEASVLKARAAIIFGSCGLVFAIAVAGGVRLYLRSAHQPAALRLEAPTGTRPAEPLAFPQRDAGETPSAAIEATPDSGPTGLASDPEAPVFDVVRIEASGDSVIAGHAAPGSTIELADGDRPLGRAVANERGEVVFLPSPLSPGRHALRLRLASPGAIAALASRPFTAEVPGREKIGPQVPLAASFGPAAVQIARGGNEPTTRVDLPVAVPPSPSEAAIRSVVTGQEGGLLTLGTAAPGSQSRVYLNGAFLAEVLADVKGLWALKIDKGMSAGSYVLRSEQVEPASGKVMARAEATFAYPILPSEPSPEISSPRGFPAAIPFSPQEQAGMAFIVNKVRTATVMRGDSLWRISRKVLGHGALYSQIYEANEKQIRDPRLVYPGQTLVLPQPPD